jgi:hypothetical protein
VCQGLDVVPDLEQVLFGLSHQRHKDFPLAPALSTKAAHDLVEVVLKCGGLCLQGRGAGRALLGDVDDELEDFF